MSTQISYKYRIYPSRIQTLRLNQSLSSACELYNILLGVKINTYESDKKSLSGFDLNKIAKDIDVPLHSQVKQNIGKRIDEAFKHFFRRVKEKKGKCGFPRFKSFDSYDSMTYPQSGFKFISDKKIFISKIGNIPIVVDRVPKGKIKTLNIKRKADKWFIVLCCSDVPIEKIIPINESVGIDVGIENFATLSNGEVIENPKFLIQSERKLAKFQRRLGRKKRGSGNRRKSRMRVAKLHERIFNQRQDFLHKLSWNIVKSFRIIKVEKLQINNMVRNHHIARSINDASWGNFIGMLSYKVERTGGELVGVNPRNTSRTCSRCGHIQDMPLSKRTFKCESCGFVCHRDLNASLNISRLGHSRIDACEQSVRPSKKAVLDEAGTIFEPA